MSSNSEQSKRSLDKFLFIKQFIYSVNELKEIRLVSISKLLQLLLVITSVLYYILSSQE